MADPNNYNWGEILRPDFKSLLYSVLGFALNQAWTIYRGRRATVTWTALFQHIKPGQEPTSTKVSVLVNGKEAVNLQMCQITVVNSSSKDIENMDLLFAFDAPFVIVEGRGGLLKSGKSLLFTEGFIRTAKAIADMPEPDRINSPSYDYLSRHREFHLSSLNRGESANFTFWVQSAQPAVGASVRTTSEKAGVKLISLPADIRPLNVALLKPAILVGVATALLFGYGLAQTDLAPLPKTMIAVIGGVLSGVAGISLVTFVRWLRRVV